MHSVTVVIVVIVTVFDLITEIVVGGRGTGVVLVSFTGGA